MPAAEQLITDHLGLWTASIKRKSGAGRGSSSKLELYGIKKLRELILELAVRGLLVPQDPQEEPASELVKKITATKLSLIKAGTFSRDKSLPPVNPEEWPFALPNGWIWERFGNLAEHNAGKTLDQGRNQGELRDYITTSNLYWGKFDLSGVRQMPIEDADLEKCQAIKSDLLICEGGEAGRAAVWNYDYPICFQNHVHRARFWQGINPYFAYRLLEKMSYSGEIDNYRKGVGISNMSGKALGSIPFPLPPVAEQNRIVAKVDELMTLCDQLEQQTDASLSAHQALVENLLSALTSAADHLQFVSNWQRIAEHFDTLFTTEESIDRLKQTILQLAVTGKLVTQDPNDEAASETYSRVLPLPAGYRRSNKQKIKSSGVLSSPNSPSLPKSWTRKTVDQLYLSRHILDYEDGNHGSLYPRSGDFSDDGVIFLTAAQIGNNGKIAWNECQRLSADYADKLTKGWSTRGDVYFTHNATVGRTAIAENPPEADFLLGTSVTFFRINDSSISPRYLYLYFSSLEWYQQAAAVMRQTTRNQVSITKQALFTVSLPPRAEQDRIAKKVDGLMELCDRLKFRLDAARTTQLHLADTMAEKALAEA